MIAAGSCLGFDIACDTFAKGGLAVMMGFVLFIGSVLLLVSAVFGRRMGYLVVAVAFFTWMIILSSLWALGLFSQGPGTKANLGPRGKEPGWVTLQAGISASEPAYPEFKSYPEGAAWREPGTNSQDAASVQSLQSALQKFLADTANEKAGLEPLAQGAFQTTDFTVQNIRFGTHGGVSLAAAQGFYNGGGPAITLFARHDSGSVPHYSWAFLIGSIIGLAIHLPFLDRAERKRKHILTGGEAPPWYGPA